MTDFYISTDNLITLVGLHDEAGAWINDADSVTMSLYKDTLFTMNTGDAIEDVQTMEKDAAATAGTWTLTYDGVTTAAIQYDATLVAIKAAIEALANVNAGDMTVTGGKMNEPDDTIFTWLDTLGKCPLMTADISGLTTTLSAVIEKTTNGYLLGSAIDEGGDHVGFPCTDIQDSIVATEKVRVQGTVNYDGEDTADTLALNEHDKIIIDRTGQGGYSAEVFEGTEKIYEGMKNGCGIALAYIGGSNGNYAGYLPDTITKLIDLNSYYLFVIAVKGGIQVTTRVLWRAVFHGSNLT